MAVSLVSCAVLSFGALVLAKSWLESRLESCAPFCAIFVALLDSGLDSEVAESKAPIFDEAFDEALDKFSLFVLLGSACVICVGCVFVVVCASLDSVPFGALISDDATFDDALFDDISLLAIYVGLFLSSSAPLLDSALDSAPLAVSASVWLSPIPRRFTLSENTK